MLCVYWGDDVKGPVMWGGGGVQVASDVKRGSSGGWWKVM